MNQKSILLSILFILFVNIVFSQKKDIDSLLTIVKNGNETDKVLALFELSNQLKYDTVELAKTYASKGLLIAEKIKNDTLIVKIINILGPILILGNDDEKVPKLYNKAIKISEKNNYLIGLAHTYNHYGAYYYNKNKLDTAKFLYKHSISIFTKIKDYKKLASLYNNLGIIFYKQVQYDSSLFYFLKSLEYKEQKLPSGKKVASDDAITASEINIGLFYYSLKKYKQAVNFLRKAENLSKKAENKNYNAIAKVNLGVVYNALSNYDSALFYHKSAIKLASEMNNVKLLSQAYTGIANVYKNTNQFEKSIEFFRKSLKIHIKLKDIRGKAIVEKSLTELYYNKNDFINAEKYARDALQSALSSKNIKIEKEIYQILAKIYDKTGNYKNAYKYQKLYITINDSINAINNGKLMAEVETKYETAKKNIQIQELKLINLKNKNQKRIFGILTGAFLIIVILMLFFIKQKHKINSILRDKNEQLRNLNSTQNRLMSIISHDLKAPLSAFYSITNSLKTKFDIIDRKEIDKYFDRMLNSSIALKLQLENLLNWAINQSHSIIVNKSSYNLQVLSFKVVMILQEFANEKNITIENNIDENIELQTDSRLMSIVLNNLISNAVKFSSKNSKIILSSIQRNKKTTIFVKDFGIGMTQEETDNLFGERLNITKSDNKETGLGLIVSKDIVEKLGGKISVKSEQNKGTEFKIEF